MEEGVASAHGHAKQQQEQERWEENGSCAALPSSILLMSSGSQTPAQIPGLPHHPTEILDATHCTSTKPHLAPSCLCLLSGIHTRRLLLPNPAPTPQPPLLPHILHGCPRKNMNNGWEKEHSVAPTGPGETETARQGACGLAKTWEHPLLKSRIHA